MEPSDEDLVRAIQSGRTEAFEALYLRHRDWVLALAWRFCRNREDALDVLQETFAYLVEKLPGLELRARLRTFLYPAVKHLALSRKGAARKLVPLEAAAGVPAPSEEPDEIRAHLGSLPEAQREVVLLRFAE